MSGAAKLAGGAAGAAESQGEQLARCQQRCQAFPALHRHLELLEAEALEDDSFAPAPASGIIFASFYAQGDRGTEARPAAQVSAFCAYIGKGQHWQASCVDCAHGELRASLLLIPACPPGADARGAAEFPALCALQVGSSYSTRCMPAVAAPAGHAAMHGLPFFLCADARARRMQGFDTHQLARPNFNFVPALRRSNPGCNITILTDQATQFAGLPPGVQVFRYQMDTARLGRNAWANYYQFRAQQARPAPVTTLLAVA